MDGQGFQHLKKVTKLDAYKQKLNDDLEALKDYKWRKLPVG